MNWAYSLHLAIDDYEPYVRKYLNVSSGQENLLNLTKPKADAEEFRMHLGNIKQGSFYCDYWDRSILTNENVTLEQFLKGLIYLLNNVISGDLVVISFSGHGEYSRDDKSNKWLFSDDVLWDYELHVLLRLFSKGVRVVVISDCCQANGMVDYYPEKIDFINNFRIYQRLKSYNPSFGEKFYNLFKVANNKTMSCELIHISATSSDNTNVNDMLSFLKYANDFLKDFNYSHSQNFYGFYKIIKQKALDYFISKPSAYRYLAFNESYLMSDEIPEEYNPNNERDRIGMMKILPNCKISGINTPQQFNKAFFV